MDDQVIKGSNGTTTNQSEGITNEDQVNLIFVKKLTGQTLSSEEQTIFAANVNRLANIAESATKLAEETDKKAKFNEFFSKLKTMTFESFEDFFVHVDSQRPKKVRKSGSDKGQINPETGTTINPVTDINKVRKNKDTYNGAIVEALDLGLKTKAQIYEHLKIKFKGTTKEGYVEDRVNSGLKNDLIRFVAVDANGNYSLKDAK